MARNRANRMVTPRPAQPEKHGDTHGAAFSNRYDASMSDDIDRLAGELDADYKEASFDYLLVQDDLTDLFTAIGNTVASAAPMLTEIEKALPMVLGLQIRVNSLTWSTIMSLCMQLEAGHPDYIFVV